MEPDLDEPFFLTADAERWVRQNLVYRLRQEFVTMMTCDSETRDRRRREYNQAIFSPEDAGGWEIWSETTLGMVLDKFDKAVKNLGVKQNESRTD